MPPTVCFEQVYKRYRLGAHQTSFREMLVNRADKVIKRSTLKPAQGKDLWALYDVSFQLEKGHALGLIGPNGAGKTTVLKILARITRPTTGTIDIQGRVAALIELGAGFHPDLTGRENVFLNGAILGLSRKEVTRNFDRIVAFSGLEKFIDTPVKRYSSGMYVRLGFSVAAHVEPDVLLVDEVLSVGDAQFRQRCAQRIAELRRMGTTIVFVAHNLYLVKSVCDMAVYMNAGRVQEHGDVIQAINGYETWLRRQQVRLAGDPSGSDDLQLSPSIHLGQVKIRSLKETGTGPLCYNDPVEILIPFQVKQPVRQPELVLRIIRADGTTCCMIRTSDYGHKLAGLEGEGVISLAIDPLQLSGGAYVLEAKLTLGSMDGLPLAQSHSSWFEVAGLSISQAEASGVFVPHVIWARTEWTSPSSSSTGTSGTF